MKIFPEELLDGRAGEVVDNRIQDTVEISQTDGEEKSVGRPFQGTAELQSGQITGVSVCLHPD